MRNERLPLAESCTGSSRVGRFSSREESSELSARAAFFCFMGGGSINLTWLAESSQITGTKGLRELRETNVELREENPKTSQVLVSSLD